MMTTLKLQRALQVLLITGISIFALAPAHAAETPKVTSNNYIRAESDFQMKGYIEKFNCFGKLVPVREPYNVNNQVRCAAKGTRFTLGVFLT